LNGLRLALGPGKSRQEQGGQDGDNRNDYQQFDQREATGSDLLCDGRDDS